MACLFANPDSTHLDYSDRLHRIWYPARQHAGVVWAQFHDVRRASATGSLLEGFDLETAQTRLGPTDPRPTYDIYAQGTTEADRQAADRLGERLLPAGTNTADRASPESGRTRDGRLPTPEGRPGGRP